MFLLAPCHLFSSIELGTEGCLMFAKMYFNNLEFVIEVFKVPRVFLTLYNLKLHSFLWILWSYIESAAQFVELVFRCSFTVLTSDGFLHQIEISQDPSASISSASASSSGLTLRRQFPQNVICTDYYPELSLLSVVSNADTSSLTSSGNSGIVSYYLFSFCPNRTF